MTKNWTVAIDNNQCSLAHIHLHTKSNGEESRANFNCCLTVDHLNETHSKS